MNDTMSTQPEAETGEELASVGRVARLTGLSPETLRVWERRYGRPTPIRLPSGHRRYSASEVRWLRRVAEALAMGWRPAKAVRASEAELDELLEPVVQPAAAVTETDELLDAARALDGATLSALLERELRDASTLDRLEHVVGPFLHRVGRAWADGELQQRHEQLASEVTEDVLRRRRVELQEALPAADTPPVLLCTLPGERHTLTLQMLALLATAQGVSSMVLGAELPVDEIVLAAREAGAPSVALSVSLSTGGLESDRMLADLGKRLPDEVALLVGGSGIRQRRRGSRRVRRMTSLQDWNAWLDELA